MAAIYGTALFATFSFLFLVRLVASHGLLYNPPQRGVTNGNQYCPVPRFDKQATIDYSAHFPAGSKSQALGAGLHSQMKAAGRRGWTLYEPLKRNFRFRAGVCGDLLWGREHLRGGKYYNGGKIFKTYRQGQVVSFDVAVTTHHNGFFVFYMCDVGKCGGEIGAKCFRRGHCHLLRRAWDRRCESRRDRGCAPIDPKYPWRWYLPCPSGKTDLYGGGKMLYQLPKNLHCEHCVLQWYWASANTCNPPGLVKYFKGNRAPNWGKCKGQGDAVGGWRRWETPCGGRRFTEEYYQCADVKILPTWQKPRKPKKAPKTKAPKKQPKRTKPKTPKKSPRQKHPVWWGRNRGPLVRIVLLGDGKPIYNMYHGSTYVINVKRYKRITFQAAAFRKVRGGVGFYFNGRRWWTERSWPYVFGGRTGVWHRPWYNRQFELAAVAELNWLVVKLTLTN